MNWLHSVPFSSLPSMQAERGWCLGKEGQANAEMEWHECEAASMRFPPIDLPEL